MPDHMDRVQDAVQAATDAAVAKATAALRREGCAYCESCGEPIGDHRKALGARLCLAHQRELENRGPKCMRGQRR